MRVLIVKTSRLGDILNALPVLDFLNQVSPGIEIDWVLEERYHDLLEGHPLISGFLQLRTRDWSRHPLAARTRREMLTLKGTLQDRAYDIVFDLQGDLKSGLVSWLSGVSHRLGFTLDDLQGRINSLFTTRQIPLRRQDRHSTDQCLRLVSVPFARDYLTMKLHFELPVAAEDDLAASTLMSTLGDGLVFLFQCGAAWQTRLWSNEGWGELGRRLLGKYPDATILFSWGSAKERHAAANLAEAIGKGARVIEHYHLKGLAALLKKVDLVVGGDTGPVHIAAAVGTPTVSLYRSGDGKRSGPRGPRHAVIQAPMECSCCFKTKCSRDRECRESITTDMIIREIERVLGRSASDEIHPD